MSTLIPFTPPPGVYRNGTAYEAKGRWYDCNLVRWKDGRLQPLGGWEKTVGATLTGIGRSMMTWRDYSGNRWLAIGTNSKLYIFDSLAGEPSDVTPSGLIEGNVSAFLGLGFGTGGFGGTAIVKSVTRTDVSVAQSTDTITSADASFKFSDYFAVGDEIQITGFTEDDNNKEYPNSHRVTAVSNNVITLGPTNGLGNYNSVNGLTITNGGTGYSAGTLSASTGGFTGTYTVDGNGTIDSVTITAVGSGYTSPPTILISDSGGSSAVITADTNDSLVDESAGDSVVFSRARRFGNENVVSSSLVLTASTWIFDLWGEDLVGMSTADGKLYEWNPASDGASTPMGVATVIANAPINNSAMMVSKERHLFALGANGNPRLIKWSEQEDHGTWTATSSNQAGQFFLDTKGKILSGKIVGNRILIWTTTDVHAIDHVGSPFIYGRRKIGESCGAISSRSMIAIGDSAYWMSPGGFWQYQGSVQPLKCDVSDFVFSTMNRVQDSKIYASSNAEFFEVTWWYASLGNDEIVRYVTFNYKEGWWSIGELCRTAFVDAGVFEDPIGISDDNTLYVHEQSASESERTTQTIATTSADVSDYDRKLVTGTDATNDVGLVFAETGGMEINNGEGITHIKQLITDSTQGSNGLRFKFKSAFAPNSTETESESFDIQPDGYTDIRGVSGRQFKLRVESGWDQDWRLGTTRANITQNGRR